MNAAGPVAPCKLRRLPRLKEARARLPRGPLKGEHRQYAPDRRRHRARQKIGAQFTCLATALLSSHIEPPPKMPSILWTVRPVERPFFLGF